MNEDHISDVIDVLAHSQRDAVLIVHPDDEAGARAAIAALALRDRPTLVVDEAIPHPGTAYYSTPPPVPTMGPIVSDASPIDLGVDGIVLQFPTEKGQP